MSRLVNNNEGQPSWSVRSFGQTDDGLGVDAYLLDSGNGLQVEILTLGGIVSQILFPDRAGTVADVALGFSSVEEYLREPHYFGAITGRVAGRIFGGEIEVYGVTYKLALNNDPNHLHGGGIGFDRRLWTAEPQLTEDAVAVLLRYRSPDGEEGYPGNVDFTVTYTVTRDNTLVFATEAVTDKITPVSLTNHTYFNLGGEGDGTIEDHRMWVDSDTIASMNGQMTLTGKLESVVGQACDLRTPQLLGDVIPHLYLQHGDTYRLCGDLNAVIAEVEHPPSGRKVSVRSTCPYLQFYTAEHFNGRRIGKAGLPYLQFAGFCLECEGYAEGVRYPELGDILVRPGQPQRHTTHYRFSVCDE